MKPTYEELELQLEESQREFRAADATIHNLELKITDMAVQLANAESKCRELAAENAGLKAVIESVQGVANQSQGIAGWHLNGAVADWDEILPEINNVETQATDASLAEVRAQGVEMFAAEYESKIEPYKNHDEFMNAHYLKMQAIEARNFAAQLRKGAAL
ncbi:hypothetical protein [Citrobacter freundii]|uniref:hypothetical protein n=1 Tax=Citrobacter freundii TaxID=546 RepID=UPI00149582E6|nr:hypothetical protein [Citrobacter freundii]